MDREKTEQLMRRVLTEGLGLDLSDPNLSDTPKRVTKMFFDDFLVNYDKIPEGIVKSFPNEKHFDEIVLLDNIPFVSLCSHHFLPFPGFAWFLYIPDRRLAGASKPARVIDFFAKKPQLQENLSSEVIDYFMKEVRPLGAMLVMRAVHGCMSCRGAKTGPDSGMVTSITRGCFRDNLSTRMEALALIQLSLAFK
jgi:GTP cyclohydrolase I